MKISILDHDQVAEIARKAECQPREIADLIFRHGIKPDRRGFYSRSSLLRASLAECRALRQRVGTPVRTLGQLLRGWTRPR